MFEPDAPPLRLADVDLDTGFMQFVQAIQVRITFRIEAFRIGIII